MFLKSPKTPRKIIVDVDAGTDDAWALFMLIRAMDAGLCEIVAITCVHGNTDLKNVVQNVFKILKITRKDHEIPVYAGCAKPLVVPENFKHDHFHGTDGFADLGLPRVDETKLQSKHAVTAICDLLKQNPGEIELILLGPLTNMAVALRMDDSVVHLIKEVFIMGGNLQAVGNITKSAEFNFFGDPEAAHIVLDTLSTICPITMVPWETCTERKLRIPMEFRLKDISAANNEITRLLDQLDDYVYVQRQRIYFKPCDALLVAVFLCPEIIKAGDDWHATVELHGKHTRGQLVLDHLKTNKSNVRIVEELHQEMFQEMLLWTVGAENKISIQ